MASDLTFPERRGPSLAVAVCVAVGLIFAGLTLALYNEHHANAQKLRDVTVQARILAASVAAPLAFDDRETAREYVDALRANPQMEAAGVYELDGKLAAGWVRGGAPLPRVSAARSPVHKGDRLIVTAPVAQAMTPLGSVYLRSVREPWLRRASRYSGPGLLILMASIMVAGLGASNASLARTHRKLRSEMAERAKAEAALLHAQRMEAQAQLDVATERGRAALRQTEAQMEFALRSGELGSWTGDLRTGQLTLSDLFRAHYGFAPDEPPVNGDDIAARVHPDDRAELGRRVQAAMADRSVLETEHRTVAPDGSVRWVLVRGRADYDEDGAPLRMAGVSLDITARKAAEERQRLLLDELNHRVKNTLAAVQSIALQTSRAAEDGAGFEAAFIARIHALARVHDLLTKVAWEGASLAEVLAQTLAPYQARRGAERVVFFGPDVRLGPNAAVTLAMAFHELATNAAKYGALSAETGGIEVTWRTERGVGEEALEIVWIESGGPPVVQPTRRGFGTQFLERAVGREFDGEVNLRFISGGLNCRIRLPLSAKLRLAA